MKKSKKTFLDQFWEFLDKHPKASRILDIIFDFNNKFFIVYSIFIAVLVVGVFVISLYYILPTEIKGELTAILGTLLSVVIMPLVINIYNRKKDNISKTFEKNSVLYEELSEILVLILTHDENTEDNEQLIGKYITEHYPKMCSSFSSVLISYLYSVYRNCKNNKYDNVKYFGEKCMKIIRKEGGVGKEFEFSSLILDSMRNQDNSIKND